MGAGGIFLVTKQPIPYQVLPHPNEQTPLIPLPFDKYCLNASKEFLDEHLQCGQTKLLNVHHLMVYLNGKLSLLQTTANGQYETIDEIATPAKQEPYLLLKIMSHYAVRLHMLLDGIIKGEVSLSHVAEKLYPLREQLVTLKQNYQNIARSELHVIDLTLVNIERASSCVDIRQFKDLSECYLREMAPHHERYGRKATELQLNGLEKIISEWLDNYAINLKSTYIVIVGSRGPKKGLIELQYFQRLRSRHGIIDVNTLSGGIIYTEMLPEQMNNVSLPTIVSDVARDLASQEIAEGILGDRTAMHRDVLSRHAGPTLTALEVEGPKLISERVSALWSSFWKPPEESKPKSKCPLQRLM
jgi:hypothetical protein